MAITPCSLGRVDMLSLLLLLLLTHEVSCWFLVWGSSGKLKMGQLHRLHQTTALRHSQGGQAIQPANPDAGQNRGFEPSPELGACLSRIGSCPARNFLAKPRFRQILRCRVQTCFLFPRGHARPAAG
jgi:hypothetical protein